MLTRYEKLAFLILKLGYAYMPTHPVHWDKNFTKLKITLDKRIWVYFFVAILFSLLISGAMLLDIGYHLFIHRLPNYNPGTIALHIIGLFGSGGFLFAVVVMAFNSEAVKGFNEIISFEKQLPQRFRPTPTPQSVQFLDLAIMAISSFCAICPVVIMITSLYLPFDPFYFIFEEISAKYPNFYNMVNWKIRFAIRIVTVSPVFECVRTISYLLISGLLVLIRFGKQIRLLGTLKLTRQLSHSYSVIRVHFQIQINFTFLNEAVHNLLSIVLSAGYWFFVIAGWVTVRGIHLMPEYMYIMIIIGGILFTLLISVLMTHISSDIDAYLETSRQFQEQARKLKLSEFLTREQKKELIHLSKLANTVKPVKMVYKPFLIIDKEFCKNYWNTATDRLFDAVLVS